MAPVLPRIRGFAKIPDHQVDAPARVPWIKGFTDNVKVDFFRTKTVKLASEKIGKDKDPREDIYRQVQNVKFIEKSGNVIEVITINDATKSECSMGSVEVYVVSKHINSNSTETSTSK